jgi:hypothetical protein
MKMTHSVVLLVLLLGFVLAGAPFAQGGAPMDGQMRGGGNLENVLSYRVLQNKQQKREKRNVLSIVSLLGISYNASTYPDSFDPAINIGPHPNSIDPFTRTNFVAINDRHAISCQIDCHSVITLPSSQTSQVYYGCVNRYYSYGTTGLCKTPQLASPQEMLLAIELCGKSPCTRNILDQPDILSPAVIATVAGVNSGLTGVVRATDAPASASGGLLPASDTPAPTSGSIFMQGLFGQ